MIQFSSFFRFIIFIIIFIISEFFFSFLLHHMLYGRSSFAQTFCLSLALQRQFGLVGLAEAGCAPGIWCLMPIRGWFIPPIKMVTWGWLMFMALGKNHINHC